MAILVSSGLYVPAEAATVYRCRIDGVLTLQDYPCQNSSSLPGTTRAQSKPEQAESVANRYGLPTTPPKPHPIKHALHSLKDTLGLDSSNACTRILDEMPGTQNDQAAHAVVHDCLKKYGYSRYCPTRHPWFGTKTATQCIIKYGKNVSSRVGARAISWSCSTLYTSR